MAAEAGPQLQGISCVKVRDARRAVLVCVRMTSPDMLRFMKECEQRGAELAVSGAHLCSVADILGLGLCLATQHALLWGRLDGGCASACMHHLRACGHMLKNSDCQRCCNSSSTMRVVSLPTSV